MALSRKYDMPVLAILIGVPEFLSACRDADARKCAARDPALYGNYAAEVAAHTRGVIDSFEILNEPDTNEMFRGTPEDYARMLASAHDAIKARSPGSTVVLGGVSGLAATSWLARVFATPGVGAAGKFDIAGVHLRGSVGSLGNVMRAWRGFFDSKGRARRAALGHRARLSRRPRVPVRPLLPRAARPRRRHTSGTRCPPWCGRVRDGSS